MSDGNLLSILLGAALGIAYGGVSWWMVRRANLRSQRSFMVTVLGGMLLRMAVASVAIVLILLLLPVDPLVFTGTFFGIFVVALVLEILLLHKRTDSQAAAR